MPLSKIQQPLTEIHGFLRASIPKNLPPSLPQATGKTILSQLEQLDHLLPINDVNAYEVVALTDKLLFDLESCCDEGNSLKNECKTHSEKLEAILQDEMLVKEVIARNFGTQDDGDNSWALATRSGQIIQVSKKFAEDIHRPAQEFQGKSYADFLVKESSPDYNPTFDKGQYDRSQLPIRLFIQRWAAGSYTPDELNILFGSPSPDTASAKTAMAKASTSAQKQAALALFVKKAKEQLKSRAVQKEKSIEETTPDTLSDAYSQSGKTIHACNRYIALDPLTKTPYPQLIEWCSRFKGPYLVCRTTFIKQNEIDDIAALMDVAESAEINRLFSNMEHCHIPSDVLVELRNKGDFRNIKRVYNEAVVFSLDIQDFTALTKRFSGRMIDEANLLLRVAENLSLFKKYRGKIQIVKSTGDGFLAIIPEKTDGAIKLAIEFAQELQTFLVRKYIKTAPTEPSSPSVAASSSSSSAVSTPHQEEARMICRVAITRGTVIREFPTRVPLFDMYGEPVNLTNRVDYVGKEYDHDLEKKGIFDLTNVRIYVDASAFPKATESRKEIFGENSTAIVKQAKNGLEVTFYKAKPSTTATVLSRMEFDSLSTMLDSLTPLLTACVPVPQSEMVASSPPPTPSQALRRATSESALPPYEATRHPMPNATNPETLLVLPAKKTSPLTPAAIPAWLTSSGRHANPVGKSSSVLHDASKNFCAGLVAAFRAGPRKTSPTNQTATEPQVQQIPSRGEIKIERRR